MQRVPAEAIGVESELRFGPFRLRSPQQALFRGAERVKLGSRAFELLVALTEHPGELVGKDQLMARLWPNLHVDETALRVHVAALRRHLGRGQATSLTSSTSSAADTS